MPRLSTHHATLTLDDQPWLMRAGELQYFRLARKQWEWNLEHKWQVPARAVQTAIGRVRSQGL